jgi:predicted lysophospholipase L1 biosynthesis ABC-type transport system permease subunit
VFTAQDGEDSNVAVISDTLARRYFPGENPVGRHLLLGRRKLQMEIVGVVGAVKHIALQNDARPEFYLPLARFTPPGAGLIVRTRGSAAPMIPALHQRVWSLDNALAANLAAPVEALLYASLAPARLATILLGFFAAATLVLGLVGVYGVLSYSVRRSTREIGIRLALGASSRDVLKIVLGEAMILTGVGLLVGIPAALLLSRYLKTLLYGVGGFDPLTYAIGAATVILAALLASYPPARRAARIDPATSLRAE